MPPKKGQRKSMPGHVHKAPMLTPSRRSPRVPAPQKSLDESSQPSKTLEFTAASPQDGSINIRSYNSKTTASSPASPDTSETPPETPKSRRRTFQSRPSRLSTVYTPTIETPATNNGSRRTRRTAALETPKNEGSEIDLPDSIGTTGWTYDQYMGNLESEGTADGPSSPTSASDMRNSSRVRKPTMRAIESLETVKRKPRRKNTPIPTPPVEKPDPLSANAAKNKVSKKPIMKTRTSKRMANSNLQKNFVLIGFDIDAKLVGKALYDLTVEALSPGFVLPSDFPESYNKARDAYYRRQDNEKYGTSLPADSSIPPQDVDTADEDQSAAPDILPTSPVPTPATTPGVGILAYEKRSESVINSDGWVETGRVNNKGEEVSLIPDQYHPYYLSHTYGYEGLPYPPVRARSGQQAEADNAHGFPPFMGGRNLPSDNVAPFVTENVKEEQARVLANAPAPAPTAKSKKTRVRKRRQTAAADADIKAEESTTTPITTDGGRKSQRRRRQTAPAPTAPSSSSPSTPPTTVTKVKSSRSAAAVAPAAAEEDKPKVQRLRLTLKPEHKAETSGAASVSAEAPAVQSSFSSAHSNAPSPALSNKRRRRGD